MAKNEGLLPKIEKECRGIDAKIRTTWVWIS